MELEFFMPMVPPTVTQQEHKVKVVKGKPIFYSPQELKNAREKLRAHMCGHVPEEKLLGAVQLVVKWLFPCGTHRDGQYKPTKPDTDNLNKMLKDVMTELGFWYDDAQVASEVCEKFFAERPGIYVAVRELVE